MSKFTDHSPSGKDFLAMTAFCGAAFVVARPAPVDAPWLDERARKLHEKLGTGGTNITDGLRKSVELFAHVPDYVLRKVWLLSDGEANVETDKLWSVVEQARNAYINVNTIGFGDKFDEPTLRKIAAATHNGKFVSVRTLRELTNAFTMVFHTNGNGSNGHHRYHSHRPETTILCIDVSPSMTERMEGKRKIDIVEEAVLTLLQFKRTMFA